MAYYHSHFNEVCRVAAKWNISHDEMAFWMRHRERYEKERLLKEKIVEIMGNEENEMMSLRVFKRIAKQVMKSSKYFRANNAWCCSFVKKYKLQNCVDLPQQ